ncbi:MAG: acyl-CoA dehydrogenase family protein [Anaerotruncus sp.]|nr:acyl-CoA dehydrogenase family protein [Anaerotruncus sp.]
MNLAEKIAIDQFYASNADGDKIGLQFNPKTNEVKVPESFHKGFKAYIEAGFHTLSFPPEIGGVGMPSSVSMAAAEYFNAGNTSLTMYCGAITGAAYLIALFGSEEVKKMYLPKMMSGEWGGTMCLTEPGAGTDVGALKSKAVKQSRRHLPHHRTENIHQ